MHDCDADCDRCGSYINGASYSDEEDMWLCSECRMVNLEDLEKQFAYLSEKYDFIEISKRARNEIRALKSAARRYGEKMEDIEKSLANISIDINEEDYLSVVDEFTRNLPESVRLYHLLNSGFMKGIDRYNVEVDGQTFNFKEVADECLLVEYRDDGVDYMPFESDIKTIQETFPNFTADELLHGLDYFIYYHGITRAKLLRMKEYYDEHVAHRNKLLDKVREVEELKERYTEG